MPHRLVKNKLVSVIITTFRRNNVLSRAIQSVLEQTYNNIEIIVVDDNESDSDYQKNTIKTICIFKDKIPIKLVLNDKNQGGAVARNNGIQIAEGEYISFLDDDDVYLPTLIQRKVEYLSDNKEYDGVFSGVSIFYLGREISKIILSTVENIRLAILLQKYNFGTGSNIFVRRKVFKSVIGFDKAFKRHQDLEFILRLLENHKVGKIEDCLVIKNDDDRQNTLNSDKLYELKDIYLDKFKYFIETHDEKTKNKIYRSQYKEVILKAFRERNINIITNTKLKKYLQITDLPLYILEIIKSILKGV